MSTMDAGILSIQNVGRPEEEKYTAIYESAFIGGLETQRSPFIQIGSRYDKRFLGGKQDTLISGSNCEISNDLTLIRRPGLVAYGPNIPDTPLAFYAWEQQTPPSLTLIVDCASGVYTYTPSTATKIFTKSAGAGQTTFFTLNDTLYMTNGVDAVKYMNSTIYTIGITAPATAPTLAFAQYGTAWQASHSYALNDTAMDSNGNLQICTTAGTSGSSAPSWSATTGQTTKDGATLVWTNDGPRAVSCSAPGDTYYYSFGSSIDSNISTASPASAATGKLAGAQVTLTGSRSTDPKVDTVYIWRNANAGAYFWLVGTVANPASGNWTYTDTSPDTSLNTDIYAPLAHLNDPPPTGLQGVEFWGGRYWGFKGQYLYFSTGADNAALLNILFNGVAPDCWLPNNVLTFPQNIQRIVPGQNCLLVFMAGKVWYVTGSTASTYFPAPLFNKIGIRSYNALDVDGSDIFLYTTDRQYQAMSPSGGTYELGYPIGDVLQDFDPTTVYVTRHVSGSEDNAIHIADGSTGWYRLNPNQVGAESQTGISTPVWSPKASIVGGCTCVGSVETSFGVHTLLVGQGSGKPILARSLTTFSDNGTAYTWDAEIGSIVLAASPEIAKVESIVVESSTAAVPAVGVLLGEISGSFTTLSASVPDPVAVAPSASLDSKRYYVAQGEPPLCRHLQVKLSGAAAATADEVYSFSIIGRITPEQK